MQHCMCLANKECRVEEFVANVIEESILPVWEEKFGFAGNALDQ